MQKDIYESNQIKRHRRYWLFEQLIFGNSNNI